MDEWKTKTVSSHFHKRKNTHLCTQKCYGHRSRSPEDLWSIYISKAPALLHAPCWPSSVCYSLVETAIRGEDGTTVSLSLCRDHVVVCPAPYEYNKFLRICYCTTPRKGQRDISAMTGVEEGLRWCIWFQDLPLI